MELIPHFERLFFEFRHLEILALRALAHKARKPKLLAIIPIVLGFRRLLGNWLYLRYSRVKFTD